MEDNMKYWEAMARPPKDALKPIKGGRLTGMSNISPQWRYKAMTQQFGVIGFGWKYEVEKRWTSPGANDEHFAFAEIKLYVKVNDVWSDAIPGEGGSMLVSKESRGFHNNDEAFKMAVTDALGTAMAKLGVAADIYLGAFDGSKYKDSVEFPKTVNTPADVKEVVPQKGMKPVDEEFKSENAEMFTQKTLLANSEMVKFIAEQALLSPKDVVISLGKLELPEEFSVAQVIEKLGE
jgi:hypothetical protein